MVAGVAAGLADALGVDPNVVRCGFVVLAIAGGFGVILYGVAWALMPDAAPGPDAPTARAATRSRPRRSARSCSAVCCSCARSGLWPGDVDRVAARRGDGRPRAARDARPRRAARPPSSPDWPFLERLPPDAADAVAVLVGTRRGALARIVGRASRASSSGSPRSSSASTRGARCGARSSATVAVVVGFALVVGPGRVAARARARRRAARAHPRRRARRGRRAPARLRAADARARAAARRRSARGGAARAHAGARAAQLAARAATTPRRRPRARRSAPRSRSSRRRSRPSTACRSRSCVCATAGSTGIEPLLVAAREAILNAARHSGAPTRLGVPRGRARTGDDLRARPWPRLRPRDGPGRSRRHQRVDRRPHDPRRRRAAVRSAPARARRSSCRCRWRSRRVVVTACTRDAVFLVDDHQLFLVGRARRARRRRSTSSAARRRSTPRSR